MSSVLKIDKLSHKYASSWAIRDINIEINKTGVIGLLGSNGAGKSTTMNIISGVLNQTEGEVYINGIDKRTDPKMAKRQIGFLPQTPPLYPDFTVMEYLTYTADLRFIDKKDTKKAVAEAMDLTGISHFKGRLIKNLSGGYKQRVGIAQAIIHKPKVVIMDEPTNGLDPNQIIAARKLIKDIAVDRTVLLSSHVLYEINLLCTDIIMIEAGKIVFSDSIDSFNNYVQPQSVLITLDNMPVNEVLENIEGVTKVDKLSEKQCRLYFSGNTDISEQVVSESVLHDWKLKEISLEKSLLDDIFKQLSDHS